jgi:hypothetical protein
VEGDLVVKREAEDHLIVDSIIFIDADAMKEYGY